MAKERMEWMRGRRAWVILILTTLLMILTALATWINVTLREALPSEDQVPLGPVSLDPINNLFGAVNSQFFILAAIFAVAGLVVRERESGTLAWVASKPVARRSIYVAKWITASLMLGLVAVLVPVAITVAVIIPTYGMPDLAITFALVLGMLATIVFFVAAGLTLGAMLPSQTGVAAAGLALLAVPLFVGAIPLPLSQFLPHSILTWFAGLVTGTAVSVVTPIAYLLITGAVAYYGMRRLERLEL